MNLLYYLRLVVVSVVFLPLAALSQEKFILSGMVADGETGQPIQGASVTIKGTANSTQTNNRGAYSLRISPQEKSGLLVVSYVGSLSQTLRINSRTVINIQLLPAKQELETVVVSGYSKAKRREEVVGAITTVSARDLQVDRPIESFDKMLEGLAAGVQVETNTELGTPVKINIRGQNSLTNTLGTTIKTGNFTSTQPLYVVDGVPITEQRKGDEGYQFGGEEFQNPLTGINPDDIESISILKDAAAAAVYGANASNGVIIITTKKGRAGKTRFSSGFSSGISNPVNRIKWLSGPAYHELVKELYQNESLPPANAEALAGSKTMDTDWFGICNRTGVFQNYDMELSGGSEASQFRISGSFLDQTAIQMGNNFQKAYFRLRLDNKLSNKWSLSTSLAPTVTRKNALSIYNELVPIIPNLPTYNADGSYYTIVGVPNPLAVLSQNKNYSEGGTLNGNFRLDFQALPNLRISGNLGTDMLFNKQNLYDSKQNETGRTKGGFAQIFDRQSFSWIAFTQANWTPKVGKNGKLDLLGGYEMSSQQTKLLRGSGTGFTYYRLNELSNASQQSSASSRQTNNSYSLYAQAAYSHKERYFLNLSARSDAASIFGADVSSTLNGGIGAGWTVSKEKWLRNSKWLDVFRVRASFGTTGNSRIGSYAGRGLYDILNSGYNGQSTSDPVGIPNPNLSWEKAYKTNVGLDVTILKRLNISFDVYNNLTSNAISTVQIPYESGFADMLANTSDLQNRGFDASVGGAIVRAGSFVWNATLNMGFNKNKVLRVNNGGVRYGASENAVALKAGYPTSAIWGFKLLGVDPLTGVEIYQSKDGKAIRADDRTLDLFSAENSYVIGDRLPDLQGGFIQNLSYKGLTLTITVTYLLGSDKFVNYRNEWNGNNLDNRNQSLNLIDRWQKPGDLAIFPKLNRQARSGIRFLSNSSRYVYDETNAKLANLSLGYTLPSKAAGLIGASRVSVYINGANLFYLYRHDSPDGRNGIREYRFSFPEAQSLTGGLKINW